MTHQFAIRSGLASCTLAHSSMLATPSERQHHAATA